MIRKLILYISFDKKLVIYLIGGKMDDKKKINKKFILNTIKKFTISALVGAMLINSSAFTVNAQESRGGGR